MAAEESVELSVAVELSAVVEFELSKAVEFELSTVVEFELSKAVEFELSTMVALASGRVAFRSESPPTSGRVELSSGIVSLVKGGPGGSGGVPAEHEEGA